MEEDGCQEQGWDTAFEWYASLSDAQQRKVIEYIGENMSGRMISERLPLAYRELADEIDPERKAERWRDVSRDLGAELMK